MSAERIARLIGGASCSGGWWRCRCPVHDSRGATLALRDGERGLIVKCHAGCERSKIIAELHRRGVIGRHPEQRPFDSPIQQAARTNDVAGRIAAAQRVWNTAQDAVGSPVVQYLAGRGISIAVPPCLRWAPRCWHSDARSYLPAMIGAVLDVEGRLIAVHRSYLTRDFRRRDRKSLGPIGGGAVWQAIAADLLMVSEGIETGLSAQQACGLPCWAALSADGIEALILPPIVKTVIVLADNDANGHGQCAAYVAAQRWLGEGRRVRIALPPEPGADFNDVLLGRAHPQLQRFSDVAA